MSLVAYSESESGSESGSTSSESDRESNDEEMEGRGGKQEKSERKQKKSALLPSAADLFSSVATPGFLLDRSNPVDSIVYTDEGATGTSGMDSHSTATLEAAATVESGKHDSTAIRGGRGGQTTDRSTDRATGALGGRGGGTKAETDLTRRKREAGGGGSGTGRRDGRGGRGGSEAVDEKINAKERVKRQRTRGQAGIGSDFKSWKTEGEMHMRQQYD